MTSRKGPFSEGPIRGNKRVYPHRRLRTTFGAFTPYCRIACSAARGGGVPPESRALSNTTRGRRTRKTRTGRQNHWDGRHGRYEEQGPKDSDRASPELRGGGSTSTPAPTPMTGCAASSPCRSGTQPGTGGFHSGRTHRRMTAARRKADALPPNPDCHQPGRGRPVLRHGAYGRRGRLRLRAGPRHIRRHPLGASLHLHPSGRARKPSPVPYLRGRQRAEPYLHPLRMPLADAVMLDEADLGAGHQGGGFGNECEGRCGV